MISKAKFSNEIYINVAWHPTPTPPTSTPTPTPTPTYTCGIVLMWIPLNLTNDKYNCLLNGLVPSDSKQLPEPMLTTFCVAIYRYSITRPQRINLPLTWLFVDVIELSFHLDYKFGFMALDKILPEGLVMHGVRVPTAEECILHCIGRMACRRAKVVPHLVKPSEPDKPGENCFLIEG